MTRNTSSAVMQQRREPHDSIRPAADVRGRGLPTARHQQAAKSGVTTMQTHRPTYVSVPEVDLHHILQRATYAAQELQSVAENEYRGDHPLTVRRRNRDIAAAQKLIDFISVFRAGMAQAKDERLKYLRANDAVTEKG
jgi:hypothetical protein